MFFSLFDALLSIVVVSTSASDCLERHVSEAICSVLNVE